MNRKALIFTTLLFALLAGSLSAQPALSVAYDTTQIGPYNVTYGDTLFINFDVLNVGNQPYSGQIEILIKDTIAPRLLDSFIVSNFVPGDTFNYSGTDIVSSNKYDGGINILVIWPSALPSGVATVDSVFDQIFVRDTTLMGVKPAAGNKRAQVYPNPSSGAVHLDFPGGIAWVENIRLQDLAGREIRSWPGGTTSLDMQNLPGGTYLLAIRFTDGTYQHKKIILRR